MSTPINKVQPLVRSNFNLAEHAYRRFNAIIPPGTGVKELENPDFWAFVRGSLRTFDEVRCIAEDGSFIASLLVTYADSFSVICKTIYALNVDGAVPSGIAERTSQFVVKQRGNLKWCVVDTKTDKNVHSGIERQSDAMRQLEEHLRALAA